MNSFFRFILRWIGKVVGLMLLIVAAVWSMTRQTDQDKWEAEAARARAEGMVSYHSQPVAPWKPSRTHDEFITMIQDVYDVDIAKFVRDDYLQVLFSSRFDEDPQATCQAIANLWYNDTRQPEVVVDSWNGKIRTGHASVINGRIITPPPPIGRRTRRP